MKAITKVISNADSTTDLAAQSRPHAAPPFCLDAAPVASQAPRRARPACIAAAALLLLLLLVTGAGLAGLAEAPGAATKALHTARAETLTMLRRADVQSIPVFLTAPTNVDGGSGPVQITVQVDQVPADGSAVQVTCDHPQLVQSPSGTWPYVVSFPPGSSTTATFTVTTSSVQSSTSVVLGAAKTGVDMSDSSNWTAATTMTCSPTQTPQSPQSPQ